MTGNEKMALVRALREARMLNYGPPVRQQFDCCVTAIMEVACSDLREAHHFRSMVDRDNWIAQDNPFRDGTSKDRP